MFVSAGIALATVARALPHPDDEIDPSKRANVSTKNAIQPSATPMKSDGVVNARIIRMSEIPIRRAYVSGDGKTYSMVESKPKVVINKQQVRKPESKPVENIRVARDMPATIPRIKRDRFRKMISEYERGRIPADEYLHGSITVGGETLDLGEINKFANPARALEDQGIPVKKAGSAAPRESGETTIPLSEQGN